MTSDRLQGWSGSEILTPVGPFLGPLWIPKINPRLILCQKGSHKERGFVDLCGERRFLDFLIDFQSIFGLKIHGKNDAFVDSCACFFQPSDLHETSYFTYREALLHFLCFSIFPKKVVQNRPQNRVQTNDRKNCPPGTRNGAQIH